MGVPLRVGLSPAIPNVGERVFTFLRLHLGARAVPSRRPFPTIPAGCMAEAGHRGGRTNGTRPSVPSHGMKFIIGISLVRPSLSRMNGNSYFTFAVIASIRSVIFSMEYFSINLLVAASVFNFSLINFSWGRSDWQAFVQVFYFSAIGGIFITGLQKMQKGVA